MTLRVRHVTLFAVLASVGACFAMRSSHGGGQTSFSPPRTFDSKSIAVPAGYRIELVASGLDMPTGVAFDEQGRAYVTEAGYSYGELWTTPRLVRVEQDGRITQVAAGSDPPWNGVVFDRGDFYVAAGGERDGGKILRVGTHGTIATVVDSLPSVGDHHTNGPAIGPDGFLYFGQGTATNAGVVGLDNFAFGWPKRHPDFHDIPCRDVTLTGQNHTTSNPVSGTGEATTGAYVAFGTATRAGEVIPGRIPCNGAVFRVRPSGGALELVAWGFRNPYGLAFAPDGQLYLTENSFDVRGSRPVFGTGDVLYRVQPGAWYGWPDFHAGHALSDTEWFKPRGKPAPGFVLATHPGTPPAPAAVLGVHSSSNGLDFSRNPAFGHVGEAFIAQFGDMAPNVGKVLSPVGFKVVRANVRTGVIEDFAVNRGKTNGPASRLGTAGLERPVAVRFDPAGTSLYVVDFGVLTMGATPQPRTGTGALWRITRVTGGAQ